MTINLDEIYTLGLWVQYFRTIRSILPIVKAEGNNAIFGLQRIQAILQKHHCGEGLLVELKKLEEKLESKYDDKTQIEPADADELKNSANQWMNKITADLIKMNVIEITAQSGLNPKELLKMASKEPGEFISEEIWNKLTDIEKSDFSDAAKCLLMGTATAAVMVVLRGAEASIGNFYHCKTNNDPKEKTWRQLTTELKQNSETLGIDDSFIGYIDYYGSAKRNFAQHPNKIYTLREAVIIFMQIIGLVGDIYSQI